jgi:hypothetical protein
MDIYSLLEKGKADDAFTRFNGNLEVLQNYVLPEILQALSSAVSQAYQAWREGKTGAAQTAAAVTPSTTADDLKANLEKAADHISQIYAMLEQGKTDDAYRHFKKYRDKLKQYADNEVFAMVEAAVTQAYNSQK